VVAEDKSAAPGNQEPPEEPASETQEMEGSRQMVLCEPLQDTDRSPFRRRFQEMSFEIDPQGAQHTDNQTRQ